MRVSLPGTFLRQTELFEMESLHSFLFRTSLVNHYDSFSVFKSVLANYFHKGNSSQGYQDTYQELSKICGYPPRELLDSTIHRFDNVLYLNNEPHTYDENWQTIVDAGNKKYNIRNRNMVAFCPICLQEKPYFRLSWYLQDITSCISHFNLLVNSCNNCGNLLTEDEVISCSCKKCNFDLRKSHVKYFKKENDIYSTLLTFYKWFFNIDFDNEVNNFNIPPLLPNILYKIYSVFLSMSQNKRSTTEMDQNKNNPTIPSNHENHNIIYLKDLQVNQSLITNAINGIIDWPNGFYKFLDTNRNVDQKLGRTVDLGLGNLFSKYIDCHWVLKDYSFIQKAFNSYLLSRQPVLFYGYEKTKRHKLFPKMINQFPYLDMTHVCSELRCRKQTVDRLAKNGYIHVVKPSWDKFEYVFSREEVENLSSKRAGSVNLTRAGFMLKSDDQTTLELAKRGILELAGGKEIDGERNYLITYQSILDLANDMRLLCEVYDLCQFSSQFISIGKLAQQTAILNVSMVDLIELIGTRRIIGVLPSRAFNFSTLYFHINTYQKVKSLVLKYNHWITLDQFAKKLSVKPSTVKHWRDSQLISPEMVSKSVCIFSENTLENFQNHFITTQVAAKILNVGILTVQKWARNGRLKPISGAEIDGCHDYRFKLSDVELLSQEKRITAPQMARKIGLSRSQMCQWIKKGKVTPISGPGIDGMKHYLFVE